MLWNRLSGCGSSGVQVTMVAGIDSGNDYIGYTASAGYGESILGLFGSLSDSLFPGRITDSVVFSVLDNELIILVEGDVEADVGVTINSLVINGTSCPVINADFSSIFYPTGLTSINFTPNVTFSSGSTYTLEII